MALFSVGGLFGRHEMRRYRRGEDRATEGGISPLQLREVGLCSGAISAVRFLAASGMRCRHYKCGGILDVLGDFCTWCLVWTALDEGNGRPH